MSFPEEHKLYKYIKDAKASPAAKRAGSMSAVIKFPGSDGEYSTVTPVDIDDSGAYSFLATIEFSQPFPWVLHAICPKAEGKYLLEGSGQVLVVLSYQGRNFGGDTGEMIVNSYQNNDSLHVTFNDVVFAGSEFLLESGELHVSQRK